MSKAKKVFIVAKKNVTDSKGRILVEKDDVGISKDAGSAYFVRIGKKARVNKNDFKIFNVDRTGDGFSKKVCNVCSKLLGTNQFQKNQNAKNNRTVRRPSCNDCRKKIDGVKLKQAERKRLLKKRPQSYEVFECPVCKKRTIPGLTSKIVIDHDHNTGMARAWICDSCNTGLGRFKDDTSILKRAIKYLEKNK